MYAIVYHGNLEMVLEGITMSEYLDIKGDMNVKLFMDEDGVCGGNIEKMTVENPYYRRAIRTGETSQLVLMSLLAGEEIGTEIHSDTDQFIRVESGYGEAIIGGEICNIKDGHYLYIIRGTKHNIINTSKGKPLKLYTIYSPPHHPKGIVEPVKE